MAFDPVQKILAIGTQSGALRLYPFLWRAGNIASLTHLEKKKSQMWMRCLCVSKQSQSSHPSVLEVLLHIVILRHVRLFYT